MHSSKGSSWPRDRTQASCSSCIAGRLLTTEPLGKPIFCTLSLPLQHSLFTLVSGLFFILSNLTWFPFYHLCLLFSFSFPFPVTVIFVLTTILAPLLAFGSCARQYWAPASRILCWPSSLLTLTPTPASAQRSVTCQPLSLSKFLGILCCCLLNLDKTWASRVVDISLSLRNG